MPVPVRVGLAPMRQDVPCRRLQVGVPALQALYLPLPLDCYIPEGRLATTLLRQVAALLNRNKYQRSWNGRIDGYGRKWLP